MIKWEIRVLLKHLLDQGLSKAAIARQVGVNRRTINRWIAEGLLDRDIETGELPKPVRRSKPPKLEPYRQIITARLESYPDLTAVRLFEELKSAGYAGGISQLRDYVAQVRPRPAPEPLVRFETEPGHQAQVDFAEFTFPWGKRYALLLVLGYSRLLWLRLYPKQDMRTLFEGMEEAFRFFGGVPREILFDQMASVITRDLRSQGGRLVENVEFLRFAAHWGFRVRACRPYRAKTKGKVERPIRYLRESFVYARDFVSDLSPGTTALLHEAHGLHLELPRVLPSHLSHGSPPAPEYPRRLSGCPSQGGKSTYRSLVLPPKPTSTPVISLPRIEVERRPLKAYAAIAAGAL